MSGYWTSPDMSGFEFGNLDDIRDALEEVIWDRMDSEFYSWLEDHYSIASLFDAFKRGYDHTDIIHECMDDIWKEASWGVSEGEDCIIMDYEFIWHDLQVGSPNMRPRNQTRRVRR